MDTSSPADVMTQKEKCCVFATVFIHKTMALKSKKFFFAFGISSVPREHPRDQNRRKEKWCVNVWHYLLIRILTLVRKEDAFVFLHKTKSCLLYTSDAADE